MKLSARTLQILKNFSAINDSLIVKKGNVLSTVSPNKEILAKATIDETFDREFAVYDIVKLLGVISMFDDPDIIFDTKCIKITKGKQTLSYYYTEASLIVAPSDKAIDLSSAEISFKMDNQQYTSVTKALHILQLPAVGIVGDRSTIKLVAMDDSKKVNYNKYEVEVGTTEHEFTMLMKGEHMKLIPGDYDVNVSSRGIASFKGDRIQYWIALHKASKFAK